MAAPEVSDVARAPKIAILEQPAAVVYQNRGPELKLVLSVDKVSPEWLRAARSAGAAAAPDPAIAGVHSSQWLHAGKRLRCAVTWFDGSPLQTFHADYATGKCAMVPYAFPRQAVCVNWARRGSAQFEACLFFKRYMLPVSFHNGDAPLVIHVVDVATGARVTSAPFIMLSKGPAKPKPAREPAPAPAITAAT